jgi:hypothetical protein
MTVLHAGVSIHNKHPQIVRAEKAYISMPVATVSIRQNTKKKKKFLRARNWTASVV